MAMLLRLLVQLSAASAVGAAAVVAVAREHQHRPSVVAATSGAQNGSAILSGLEQRWRRLQHSASERVVLWENSSAADSLRLMETEALQVGHEIMARHPGPPENEYDLFRREDLWSWIFFFVLFIVLIVFDNFVLQGKDDEPLSFTRALVYSGFWLLCALGFNVYVYFARGFDDAVNWGTGYLLEWMLSVDNLFVFRSIFLTFGTPDSQKHKPLFWGIMGAVVFRMLFFAIEEVLLHSFSFMYVLLGAFLVYTGLKIMMVDDDEEITPENDPVLQKITEKLPYVNHYAPTPLFFARIEEFRIAREDSSDSELHSHRSLTSQASAMSLVSAGSSGSRGSKVVTRFDATKNLRATKLLLVVICLELTDVVFAVDSVSAIVAQIPDLFLAYTACVFAMLGLRATFFVVDELVKLFSLLSYGVAAILIFIGFKLCLKGYIHIPHEIVCAVLVSTLFFSIFASWVQTSFFKQEDEKEKELTWAACSRLSTISSRSVGNEYMDDEDEEKGYDGGGVHDGAVAKHRSSSAGAPEVTAASAARS